MSSRNSKNARQPKPGKSKTVVGVTDPDELLAGPRVAPNAVNHLTDEVVPANTGVSSPRRRGSSLGARSYSLDSRPRGNDDAQVSQQSAERLWLTALGATHNNVGPMPNSVWFVSPGATVLIFKWSEWYFSKRCRPSGARQHLHNVAYVLQRKQGEQDAHNDALGL